MKWSLAITAIAAFQGVAPSAQAQLRPAPAYSNSAILTPPQRTEAVEAIISAIEDQYVFPDRVPTIVETLRAGNVAGRYETTDPAIFATRISEDISRAGKDTHLYLQYDPQYFSALNRPPASATVPDGDSQALLKARARRTHYGLGDSRLLPGNIRYLRISGFDWIEDETGGAYDDAMRFLRDSDAVIIDIRGNGGGSHDAVRYALSHFLPSNRLLMTFYEAGKDPEQSHTLSNLPAGRMIGKPLYVLMDGSTASAAEDFAYSVQQFKIGRLIGENTAGGANNNRYVPIPSGFLLSVSFGRPVHSVSKANWEGTGVTPDVRTASVSALDQAELEALNLLEAGAGDDSARRAEYDWARVAVEARIHPVMIAGASLRPRAGQYGDATVEYRDGAIWMRTRPGAPMRRMLPLTPDGLLFALEGHEMLRARFNGADLETLWRGVPTPIVYTRSRR